MIPLSAGSLPIAFYVLDPPVRWKVLGGSPWGTPASEDCKALDLPRGQTHLIVGIHFAHSFCCRFCCDYLRNFRLQCASSWARVIFVIRMVRLLGIVKKTFNRSAHSARPNCFLPVSSLTASLFPLFLSCFLSCWSIFGRSKNMYFLST